MNSRELKTGQSIDPIKEKVLNPEIIRIINEIPNLSDELSILDLGCGDSTSTYELLKLLYDSGHQAHNLCLIDSDTNVFPDIVSNYSFNNPITNAQIVESKNRAVYKTFLEINNSNFDIAFSQLVLHQINNDAEASYLLYSIFNTLKQNGRFILIDLHPQYYEYLLENEPNKFKKKNRTQDILAGDYFFDKGGSAPVFSRPILQQISMLGSLGFDLIKWNDIIPHALSQDNSRYKYLTDHKIPMFYLMEFKKNMNHFISETIGTIKEIKLIKNQPWLSIKFVDDEEIKMPEFKNWQKVIKGSELILHETHRKLKAQAQEVTFLYYWIINLQNNITGNLMIAPKQAIL